VVPSVAPVPVLPLTWAMGASLLFPSLVAELSRAAPEGMAGLALGGSALLSGLGVVLGPVAAGALTQFLWPAGPFLAGAAVLVAVALVMPRPHPPATDPAGHPDHSRSAA
jgi:MFS family permease